MRHTTGGTVQGSGTVGSSGGPVMAAIVGVAAPGSREPPRRGPGRAAASALGSHRTVRAALVCSVRVNRRPQVLRQHSRVIDWRLATIYAVPVAVVPLLVVSCRCWRSRSPRTWSASTGRCCKAIVTARGYREAGVRREGRRRGRRTGSGRRECRRPRRPRPPRPGAGS